MIEITFSTDQVLANFGGAPAAVHAAVLQRIKVLQVALVNLARQAYDDSGLKSRTGNLKGSIQPGPIKDTPEMIQGGIVAGGGDAFYARIQEYGGTITPKVANFLTIPIGDAKTAMGVARFSARQLIAHPASYGYDGTFFKHQMLFGKKGKQAIPLFVLKDSVTLPARHFMATALSNAQELIVSELNEAVGQAVT